MVHEEHQQAAAFPLDLKAAADAAGEVGAGVGVVARVRGAARVVQQQREIEDARLLHLVEELLEKAEALVRFAGELVEPVDGAQRVLVGGVAVEELVLHEAVERAELRQVAAEEADAVHLAQHAGHIALAREDGGEAFARGLAVAEGLVDQRQSFSARAGKAPG